MTNARFPVAGLLCPFVLLWVCSTELAGAQELTPPASQARRTIAAERLAPGESITLDGSLDEGVWRRAQVATDFIQIDPDNGEPATEQTEFRIVFNGDELYLGAICQDSEAGMHLSRYQMRRGASLVQRDK